jgi:glutathione synthase/RimK-type ligase-like ATP-grasp enzyme
MITVISSQRDDHAVQVLELLNQQGVQVVLLDLSHFPQQLQLSITFDGGIRKENHTLTGPGINLDFSECRVIWWRRPQPFVLHSEVSSSVDQTFAYTESHSAFSGLWLTLDAFWINHPTRDEEAARKVYQLKVAQELGFRIPATCITNNPERVRHFIDCCGSGAKVYKAFSGTEQAWRETRLLKPDEVKLIDSVRYAPVIFQEYIPAIADLRITIVGEDIFPAAIYSQETSYKVDFRMTMNEARIEALELPGHVVERLYAYMKYLGLVYGAIDMRLTPDGQYVFLEINPSGQWLFIEQRTHQPITESLVKLMLHYDRNDFR